MNRTPSRCRGQLDPERLCFPCVLSVLALPGPATHERGWRSELHWNSDVASSTCSVPKAIKTIILPCRTSISNRIEKLNKFPFFLFYIPATVVVLGQNLGKNAPN
jgi:hypothetical protein